MAFIVCKVFGSPEAAEWADSRIKEMDLDPRTMEMDLDSGITETDLDSGAKEMDLAECVARLSFRY